MPDEVSRRMFMTGGAAAIGSLAVQVGAAPASAQGSSGSGPRASRPNIILFMPDELRADALGCYGNPLCKTPNFDRLAQEGTLFRDCHVQYPICGASRCSLLTGWPTSVRGHRSQAYFLRPDEPNMFRYLRQAGYDVFWFGKNDALAAETFHNSVTQWGGGSEEGGNHIKAKFLPRTGLPGGNAITFLANNNADSKTSAEVSDLHGAFAILKRQEHDRPFCIFLALSSPHPPYAPFKDFDVYSPADIHGLRPAGLPNEPAFRAEARKAYGLDHVSADVLRTIRAKYYGAVAYSDWLLGQVMETLDRTGHANDTALFVMSDHGDYAGDYGLVEKWPSDLIDPLTHVPLIAKVPGGARGHVTVEPVMLYDVMNTCLELAATQASHTHFSRSLLPQMTTGQPGSRTAAFAEGGYNSWEPQCFENAPPPGDVYYPRLHLQISNPRTVSRTAMVRTPEFKLVQRPQGGSELYQYRNDPQELHNRFGDPALAKEQAAMQQRLLEWYIDTTGIAPFDKDARNFPPFNPSPDVPLDDLMVGG